MLKKYYAMEVNVYRPTTLWSPTFFKISFFVFNKRKKLLQSGNNLRASK